MTTNSTTQAQRVQRTAHLKWIPIKETRVSELAQRNRNDSKVSRIAANFDVEEVGAPTVNSRDGHWYVIDGQHRIWAMFEMSWDDQSIQCWAYEGLTEQEEAEKFLKLNDTLTVKAFDRFKVAVTAQRPAETEIDRVVRTQGLSISETRGEGAIRAVSALTKVYARSDSATLGRTLRIIRDAYGTAGLESLVIEGIGLVCARYNGELDDTTAITRLSGAHGGVSGLLGRTNHVHAQFGGTKAQALAAAAVEFINRGKGGKKLPNWWRES